MRRATQTSLPTEPTALLRAALAERCAKNPQYSIRSFARSSGISHTVLSLVLSGKRRLSKKASMQLAQHLELAPDHTEKVMRHFATSTEPSDYEELSLDAFEVISDWYHYAILSALELPNAKWDARWFAKQFGIQILEAKLAMERLQRLKLVEEKNGPGKGQWKQTSKPIKVDNTTSTAATRKFHKQLLARAIDAIDLNKIDERDFSSTTFAMDPSLIPFAAAKIRKFRRELVAELEAKGTAGAVYNITMQLFPVTKLNESENE